MAKYTHRCSRAGCRRRTSLNHKITWYIQQPKCPGCGKRSLKYDPAVMRQRDERKACHCDGAHHSHRPGSVPLCVTAPKEVYEKFMLDNYGDEDGDTVPF